MFNRILFCTDFSENSHLAFTYALNLAKTYKATLFILHVKHDPSMAYSVQVNTFIPEEIVRQWEAFEQKNIDEQLTTNYLQKMNGFREYKTLLRRGAPFYEIIQAAKEESVELIVMGTHGRTGLDHILFGSTAENVVRKSPIPVLTVRLPGKKFVMP